MDNVLKDIRQRFGSRLHKIEVVDVDVAAANHNISDNQAQPF